MRSWKEVGLPIPGDRCGRETRRPIGLRASIEERRSRRSLGSTARRLTKWLISLSAALSPTDSYAPLRVTGTVHPARAQSDTDLLLDYEDVELCPVGLLQATRVRQQFLTPLGAERVL